jgi:hypothetical protein
MIFKWLYEMFVNDRIESYPEPNSPSGFGWKPANSDPIAESTIHTFDGEPSFWSQPTPILYISHLDLYPRPSSRICNTYVDSATGHFTDTSTYSNVYPIEYQIAINLNDGNPIETKPFGADELLVVTDAIRRNYNLRR